MSMDNSFKVRFMLPSQLIPGLQAVRSCQLVPARLHRRRN